MATATPFRNAKYEATGETKNWLGVTLHRIRAVTDIAALGITAGTLGGWIESEKCLSVSGDAWVYGDAQVYGNARVSGDAQVYGNARVSGDAQVYGNARVSGNAQVYGNAWVYGNARVSGDAQVYGNAWVYGDAQVYGNARVSGDAQVYGNARVSGNAQVYGNAWVYGNARVSGDAQVYGNALVSGNASKTPIHIIGLRWSITIADQDMQIGCQEHAIERWWGFEDRLIDRMDSGALEFWKEHKATLQALCAATGRPFAKAEKPEVEAV